MNARHLSRTMAERADVAESIAQAALDESSLVRKGTQGLGQTLLQPESHAPFWLISRHIAYSTMLYASRERKADWTGNCCGRAYNGPEPRPGSYGGSSWEPGAATQA